MNLDSLKNKIIHALGNNKIQFIFIFLITVIVASGTIFLLTGDNQNTSKVNPPDPPVDPNAYYLSQYNFDTVQFTYKYTGPAEPPKEVIENQKQTTQQEIVPIRAIIHTTDKITKETILHEFDPHSRKKQTYTVELEDIAKNPSDPLRTHPEINFTLVYSNGAIEHVSTISSDENQLKSKLSVSLSKVSSGSTIVFRLSNIKGEKVIVKAPNKTETMNSTENVKKFTFKPKDYYIDKNGDGIYETKKPVNVYVTYKNIKKNAYTFNPSYTTPTTMIVDSQKEGYNQVRITKIDKKLAARTPGGKYLSKNGLKTNMIKSLDGQTVTVDKDAEKLQILINNNGTFYVVKTVNLTSQ